MKEAVKPTYIPTFRQIRILYHLYKSCQDANLHNAKAGKFTGLSELAKQLGCCRRTVEVDIHTLAINNVIDIEYSNDKKTYYKSFRIPGCKRLYEILIPFIKESESALIDIYQMTGATSCLDLVKFDNPIDKTE